MVISIGFVTASDFLEQGRQMRPREFPKEYHKDVIGGLLSYIAYGDRAWHSKYGGEVFRPLLDSNRPLFSDMETYFGLEIHTLDGKKSPNSPFRLIIVSPPEYEDKTREFIRDYETRFKDDLEEGLNHSRPPIWKPIKRRRFADEAKERMNFEVHVVAGVPERSEYGGDKVWYSLPPGWMPLKDFIKKQISELPYTQEQKDRGGDRLIDAALGNTFRAARKAGYTEDIVEFINTFYDVYGEAFLATEI